MMNKKGTLSIWIELTILLIIVVAIMGIIGTNMNAQTGQSHDLTFGLQTNTTQDAIVSLQGTITNSTSEGQTSLTDYGIFKLATLPHIIYVSVSMLWNFIGGNFINTLVGMMYLGEYSTLLIIFLKLLYWLAIAFILIKLILKIQV